VERMLQPLGFQAHSSLCSHLYFSTCVRFIPYASEWYVQPKHYEVLVFPGASSSHDIQIEKLKAPLLEANLRAIKPCLPHSACALPALGFGVSFWGAIQVVKSQCNPAERRKTSPLGKV